MQPLTGYILRVHYVSISSVMRRQAIEINKSLSALSGVIEAV